MAKLRASLFLKLLIPTIIIIPLLTGVVSYLFRLNSQQLIRRIAVGKSEEVASLVNLRFHEEIKTLTLLSQLIASDKELATAVKGGNDLQVAQIVSPISVKMDRQDRQQIDVYNREGVSIKSFAAGKPTKQPLIGPAAISGASLNQQVELFKSERRLGVTYPLKDGSETAGVIVVSASLDDILESIKRSTGTEVSIFNNKGAEIHSTNRKLFAGVKIEDLIGRAQDGPLAKFEPGNGEFSYFAEPLAVGENTYTLGYAISHARANDEIRRAMFQIIAYIGSFGVVLLILSWIGGRVLLSPIRALVSASEHIAGGDLTARADIKTGDEIEELATIFNWMADRLQLRITQAEEMAIIDSLTGLYNHRYFYEQLDKEVERAERFNGVLSVLFCDIDNFKVFNDQNGHTFGDSALKKIAQLIQMSVRTLDTPARYGGEEFAVILPETTSKEAVEAAERLRAAVAGHQFKTRHNIEFPLTLSVGIATYPTDAETPTELIARADMAMYQAKADGKNLVRTFNEQEMSRRFNDRDVEREIENIREKMLLKAVFSLAVAVDARDRYTRRHSEFVAKYGTAIARRLPVSERFIKDLSIAGLLHDAGKIGIPDSILNKCDPLIEPEWEPIRRHPSLGAEIARNIGPDATVLKSIRHHHENYDGTGYPDNLRGEKIPLGARIIAVVDAFHAMISDRPYRKAMGVEAALDELTKKSGTQFDSGLVDILKEILSEEGLVLSKVRKPGEA
ncbi:MAG: diguanylate cyclase [Actinobacteria bacterium]|nr:diguanylate cyclase [Actinomycetota bacterium]